MASKILDAQNRWRNAPPGVLTTGIGSLPHHNVDAALSFCFRHTIPYLPQIPIRNPKEYMIVQALEGLPGLVFSDEGEARVQSEVWEQNGTTYRKGLEYAFRDSEKHVDAFESFEPSPEVWKSWKPFVWELEERQIRLAKVQLAGPLTCQWALRFTDGSPIERRADLSTTVLELVLARALSMVRRLRVRGIQALLFVDEPGLYCFDQKNAMHRLALNELRLFLQAVQREGALTGLHCCSNTDWKNVLNLPLDVLSLDVRLSLENMLSQSDAVSAFIERGGRFALGVIPTGLDSNELESLRPHALFDQLLREFRSRPAAETKSLLQSALFSPACGLALHSIEEAERILSYMTDFSELIRAYTSR